MMDKLEGGQKGGRGTSSEAHSPLSSRMSHLLIIPGPETTGNDSTEGPPAPARIPNKFELTKDLASPVSNSLAKPQNSPVVLVLKLLQPDLIGSRDAT